MTTPLWALLLFAAWTLIVLAVGVGLYRWSRILSGRSGFGEYGEYRLQGATWYQRGMRAHANCVENLPIFGAIVLVISVAGLHRALLDVLSVVVIGARVPHSIVHIAFEQNNFWTGVRSLLYNIQFAAMAAMVVVVLLSLT